MKRILEPQPCGQSHGMWPQESDLFTPGIHPAPPPAEGPRGQLTLAIWGAFSHGPITYFCIKNYTKTCRWLKTTTCVISHSF